jgi:hypothetical protein
MNPKQMHAIWLLHTTWHSWCNAACVTDGITYFFNVLLLSRLSFSETNFRIWSQTAHFILIPYLFIITWSLHVLYASWMNWPTLTDVDSFQSYGCSEINRMLQQYVLCRLERVLAWIYFINQSILVHSKTEPNIFISIITVMY